MLASEIRAKARESLAGKWGKAALLTLTYAIIVFVIEFVCNLIPVIGSIAIFVISTPISYGLLVSFIKLKKGEEVGYVDFLTNGFSSFGKVWGVIGNTILKMILPVCLVVISIILIMVGTGGTIAGLAVNYSSISSSATTGLEIASGFGILLIVGIIMYIASLVYAIVKGFLYSLSFYILYDNPDMTGKEIVGQSENLMKGNRWKLFCLNLSFIGWMILCGFTFGIGLLWLMPYIMIATICFYEVLAGKNTESSIETTTEE